MTPSWKNRFGWLQNKFNIASPCQC